MGEMEKNSSLMVLIGSHRLLDAREIPADMKTSWAEQLHELTSSTITDLKTMVIRQQRPTWFHLEFSNTQYSLIIIY